MMAGEIDRRLLSEAEAAEYDLLLHGAFRDFPAAVARCTVWVTAGAVLCWVTVTLGLFVGALHLMDAGGIVDDVLGFLALAVGLGGYLPVRAVGVNSAASARQAALSDFVARIRADERALAARQPKPAPTTHFGITSRRQPKPAPTTHFGITSRRQEQHEWYGSHSELNWRDREIAEVYGLDVETYIANVKEAE